MSWVSIGIVVVILGINYRGVFKVLEGVVKAVSELIDISEKILQIVFKEKSSKIGFIDAELTIFDDINMKKGINFSPIRLTLENISNRVINFREFGVIINHQKHKFNFDEDEIPVSVPEKKTYNMELTGKNIQIFKFLPPYGKTVKFKIYGIDSYGRTFKSRKCKAIAEKN